MKSEQLIKIFLILSTLVFAENISAQIDAHYWSHQYGAKGLLLNGAVIASPDGETSIFYNPGAMALDDDLGFSFSFLSPTYSNLTVNNFIGNDNSFNDDGISYSPGFAGVRFKPFQNDNIVAAFAMFTRYKTTIGFEDRVVDEVNSLGILLFRADLDFQRKLSEDWVSFGIAAKISDRLGIGLTQVSLWHSQDLAFNLKKEIVQNQDPSLLVQSWRNEFAYSYNVYSGFLTKLGMTYRGDRLNLGLTFTTPTYSPIKKTASYQLEDIRANKLTDTYTTISNRDNTELQNFKSPMSMAIGLDYKIDSTIISIGAEYFFEIDEYTLIEESDDSFDGISDGDAILPIQIKSQNERVLNIAIGIQHQFSERTKWYGGLRTDFSQNNILSINQSTEYLGYVGDIFHVSGGFSFFNGRNHFSLGMDLGYGRDSGGDQLVDLTNITPNNLFTFSGNENVTSRFYSIMLFFTYDFIFGGSNN